MSPPLPACRHRGAQFAPGHWVCASWKLVVPAGVTADICRLKCPYVDHPESEEPGAESGGVGERESGREAGVAGSGTSRPPPVSPSPTPRPVNGLLGEGYGVVIGTYDSRPPSGAGRYGVESVHLNLAVLRATCGPEIRVLVCDDGSPPESRRRYREVCRRFRAEFESNPTRLGHTTGDMLVYRKAVCWAKRLGLRTVTKLSHRMVIDVPNWVQQDSEQLISSGHATMAQMLANFSGEQVRTECVMMVVARWHRSEILRHYDHRKAPWWNEGHTFRAIRRFVDHDKPYPGFLPWTRLHFIRGRDRPPVYFRQMAGHAEAEFRRLAAKYRVPLSENFCVADSIVSADYQR